MGSLLRRPFHRTKPARVSRPPTVITIGRVGNAAIKTKPVTNVPRMAPAVPMAENEPTTSPVRVREASLIFTTIGGTAERSAAGRKNPRAEASTIDNGPVDSAGPTPSTIKGDAIDVRPPPTNSGPKSDLGSMRSAYRPPSQAPTEMPARITPIIPVNTSRLTPRYGASSRAARISITSTDAEVKKTSERAR